MAEIMDKLTNSEAMGFIDKVAEPFKNLPHLPKGIVEFFVNIAPWLAIIGAVLGLIAGPVVGLVGTFGTLLSLNPMVLITTVVTVVVTLANSVLLFMAFNPLKNREMKGWVLLFWSQVLGIISSVMTIVTGGYSSVIGIVIATLIGFYILFEMRPFYGIVLKVVEKAKKATK